MEPEIAKMALQLIGRSEIKGAEAQAVAKIIEVIAAFIPEEEVKVEEDKKKDEKKA